MQFLYKKIHMQQTTATVSQPATPGQSAEHWGTKSFSYAAITFILIIAITALAWRYLIRGVRLNLGVRVVVYL
jgi:hypothetical protein